MRNEPSGSDVKELWQNQSRENIKMSREQFRQRAEKLRTKALWMAVASDVCGVALLLDLAYTYPRIPNLISRLGIILLAAGATWVFYRQHKRWWPRDRVQGTVPESGVAAYRSELVRRRDASREMWKELLPVLPGCIVFAVPPLLAIVRSPVMVINALPFCGLLLVWLVMAFPYRRRKLQKLQGEIDSLNQAV